MTTAPVSKADYVYAVLLEEIRTAQIPGGTALRATAVAARLGVSVTPVREALRRLEKDRLVRYQAHHGATVVDLGDAALEEFYGVRAALEGLGARLAAARVTPAELDGLRALHESMAESLERGEAAGLGELSRDFHLRIADIGGPAFLGQQARAAHNSFPVPPGASLWLEPPLAARQLAAHAAVLRALEEADADAAERVMTAHIRDAGAWRRAHLSGHSDLG
jgi:DNA-binding GntR family transcriptional regulator